MTQIINNKYVLNGVQGVLGQSFVGGISDVFGTSPKAQLYFEGGFVGGIATQQVNPNLKAGKTIGDFPWPTIKASLDHPVVGAADFAAAFKDNARGSSSSSSTSQPAPPGGSGCRRER